MEAFLRLMGGKLAWLLGGVGMAAGMGLAKRYIPRLIGKYLGGNLDKFLSTSNPEDRELLMALVKWAEAKIPERGMGKARYRLAADKLTAMFPAFHGREEQIAALVEDAVDRVDEELRKRLPGANPSPPA